MNTVRPSLWHGLLLLATLLLFAFANLYNPLINEDGVLYLLLAERIASEGLDAAFSLFDKPLYSALIAALHSLLGLPLRQSALLIDAALACLLVAAFAEFCRLLYRDRSVLPWAALLLLAHPRLNNYFAFVIRDLGYWALLLSSFCLLLRDIATPRAAYLLGWALCTLLAAAFKPEALLFAMLPLALLGTRSGPFGARGRRALGAVAVVAAAMALLTLIGVASPQHVPETVRDLPDVPGRLVREIPAAFAAATERYAALVLDPYSRDVAALSLAGGLLSILLAKTLNNIGIISFLLLAYALRRGELRLPGTNRGAFALMIGCALLLPALFLFYRQFLDSRYVMLLCLLLLAPTARSLQLLAARAATAGRARLFAGVVLVVLGTDFALGLNKPKPYLIECSEWLRQNTTAGVRIFSNDKQLIAQTGSPIDLLQVQGAARLIADRHAPLEDVAYWVIHIKRGQQQLADDLLEYDDFLTPVKRFENARGDLIVIYRPL